MAEADGNRTRLTGIPGHNGFEDRARHQTRNASRRHLTGRAHRLDVSTRRPPTFSVRRSAAHRELPYLFAGSPALRFGVSDAGIASSKDPKYTVVPQRERVDARRTQTLQPEVTTT